MGPLLGVRVGAGTARAGLADAALRIFRERRLDIRATSSRAREVRLERGQRGLRPRAAALEREQDGADADAVRPLQALGQRGGRHRWLELQLVERLDRLGGTFHHVLADHLLERRQRHRATFPFSACVPGAERSPIFPSVSAAVTRSRSLPFSSTWTIAGACSGDWPRDSQGRHGLVSQATVRHQASDGDTTPSRPLRP